MKIAVAEAANAMQANMIGAVPDYVSYTIDTRSLQPGQTYLALVGTNFDGHRFIAQAQAAGAVAAIVSDASALPAHFPAFVVENTHTALLDLARAARGHFCGAVIAITGSAGKTTTKAFLAYILEQARIGGVAATPLNENNEIGVSKVLLALESEAAAVIEMGARNPEDISLLIPIARPHVSVLTNVGDAHVGIFGSREALADAKWQIFSGNARPILSLNDAISRERAASLREEPVFCGLIGDEPMPNAEQLLLDGHTLLLRRPKREDVRVELTSLPPGEHNVRNLLSACAAAHAIGVPLETIARGASHVTMPAGRYERLTAPGGITLIHDAYNASPSGTVATLHAFAEEPGRRIVMLGCMAELGEDAVPSHRRVGAALAGVNAEHVVVLGEFADDIIAGAVDAGVAVGRVTRVENIEGAVAALSAYVRPGDVVVVKGSRMYRLERVIEALMATVPA